jgi:hypothetical protein
MGLVRSFIAASQCFFLAPLKRFKQQEDRMQFHSRYVRFAALAVLLIAALLLQACTAVQPGGTAAAGAAGAAAAPAADGTGKWCKDVKLTFFPGGPAGGAFVNNVYNGAKQAEADLGPTVS